MELTARLREVSEKAEQIEEIHEEVDSIEELEEQVRDVQFSLQSYRDTTDELDVELTELRERRSGTSISSTSVNCKRRWRGPKRLESRHRRTWTRRGDIIEDVQKSVEELRSAFGQLGNRVDLLEEQIGNRNESLPSGSFGGLGSGGSSLEVTCEGRYGRSGPTGPRAAITAFYLFFRARGVVYITARARRERMNSDWSTKK